MMKSKKNQTLALLTGITSLMMSSSFVFAEDPAHKESLSDQKPIGTIMNLNIPKGAKVFFKNLKNGATVKKDSDLMMKFGIEKMAVKPAGDLTENSGHYHLVIDGLSIEKGTVVPFDDHHIHFGKAQTETTIKLPEGKHTLTLQFANGSHISYGSELSKTIEVMAK